RHTRWPRDWSSDVCSSDLGVTYFRDGKVQASYGVASGLGEGRVNDLQLGQDGALWAATEGGLSRLKNGRVATLTSKNGLPCDARSEERRVGKECRMRG